MKRPDRVPALLAMIGVPFFAAYMLGYCQFSTFFMWTAGLTGGLAFLADFGNDRGPWRSSRGTVLLRLYIAVYAILWLFLGVGFNGLVGFGMFDKNAPFDIWMVGLIALMWTCVFMFFSWVANHVFFELFFSEHPDYKRFRELGGDPAFDLMIPWPINPDPFIVRIGGRPEPKGQDGPGDWRWQCRRCGALMPEQYCQCPHCKINWIPDEEFERMFGPGGPDIRQL